MSLHPAPSRKAGPTGAPARFYWPGTSFSESGLTFGAPIDADLLTELDTGRWELYRVAEGFAENHDLAGEHRGRPVGHVDIPVTTLFSRSLSVRMLMARQ